VHVVERDPSVVARLLHIVNSAFFAAPRPLDNATDTIRYLGSSLLKSLLLSSEVFNSFNTKRLPAGFSLDEFQAHALLTGKIAGRLVEVDKEKAITAGLLHGLGKLIFADRMPNEWGAVLAQSRQEQRPLAQVELEHFDTTHADVGAYLLGIWGLPQDLVEAVADYCNPTRNQNRGLGLVAAVHVASVLAAQELGASPEDFDTDLLDSLNGASSVDAWRTMTSRLAG